MSDLKFQLSDFLDVKSQHERTITIRMGTFKQLLKDKIKELAVERCQDWLEAVALYSSTTGDNTLQKRRCLPPKTTGVVARL